MRTLASLDIETTGLDPDRDAILEIGIVRFRPSATSVEVQNEWRAVINPQREIPAKITQLTGITEDMVAREGISLWDALRQAERIVGDAPILGHNINFDLGFLRKQRVFLQNEGVDTFELASVLVPYAGRYSLSALGKELGIDIGDSHRALDDARTAMQLYQTIFTRALELPNDVLEEITRHAERVGWLSTFWRSALEEQARGAFSGSIGARLKGNAKGKTRAPSAVLRRQKQLAAKPLTPNEDTQPINVDETAHTLETGGAFAQHFANYEVRPQQVAMLRKVADTLNDGGQAIIEAGTGTGKSFAYLVPTLRFAMQNNERVVISTNTVNLQEQLLEKDVPAVIEALGLGDSARAAVMKGKGRYVCPSRVSDLRRAGPKSLDEVRLLTKILIWQPNTLTGDADELFVPAPGERATLTHLTAANPACNMNTCTATDCYFYQARRLAESAHLVIVNHALLLADVAVENRALPEYHYLVLDEGHHMEDAATDSLTYRLTQDELSYTLDELAKSGSVRGKSSGVLSDLLAISKRNLPVDKAAACEQKCNAVVQAIEKTQQHNSAFFEELAQFMADSLGPEAGDYTQKVRITRATRNQAGWSRVELTFDNVLQSLTILAKALDGLLALLNDLSEELSDIDLMLGRITGVRRFVVEASEQLNGIIAKPVDERIYWAEIEFPKNTSRARGYKKISAQGFRVTLNTAPLHVGKLMDQHIWKAKKAVVLTSATMRTATPATKNLPTFNYIQGRLDAIDAETLAVGSPFDYKRSTLVYCPTDIPEPNQPGYQQALDRALIELFRASGGRGMALFTSYTGLRTSSRAISPELLRHGITVFEQSDGMSRRTLLEQFTNSDKGVLLGTRSFWEGVDVQGEKLSALAICKLPFDVPTDPIFSARSETFDDAFNEYSVPETVLRFRQGFGRLIRSKTDRGVVAVLDRRVISKGYGQSFINALPDPTIMRAPIGQMAAAVDKWLKLAGAPMK
jgi:DNA polymerase-3 subunit epsilon/ATP-dependent DNA helicase DinG